MRIFMSLLGAALFFPHLAIAADDRLAISVDYQHQALHVHYNLPCVVGETAWLRSEAAAKPSWQVSVSPHWESSGLLKIVTTISEDGMHVQKSTVILPLGESAVLTSEGDGDKSVLTLKPELSIPAPSMKIFVRRIANIDLNYAAAAVQKFVATAQTADPRVLVQIDERTGSLVVKATPVDLGRVKDLLDELDKPRALIVGRFEDLPEAAQVLRVPLLVKALPEASKLDCKTLHDVQQAMQSDVDRKIFADFHREAAILILVARQGACGAAIEEVNHGVQIDYPGSDGVTRDVMNFFDDGKVVSWGRDAVGKKSQVVNFKEDGSVVVD